MDYLPSPADQTQSQKGNQRIPFHINVAELKDKPFLFLIILDKVSSCISVSCSIVCNLSTIYFNKIIIGFIEGFSLLRHLEKYILNLALFWWRAVPFKAPETVRIFQIFFNQAVNFFVSVVGFVLAVFVYPLFARVPMAGFHLFNLEYIIFGIYDLSVNTHKPLFVSTVLCNEK